MYDPVDSRGVPQSRGIPRIVQLAAIVGIIAIFVIGGSVIHKSAFGKVWPSDHSMRVDLQKGEAGYP